MSPNKILIRGPLTNLTIAVQIVLVRILEKDFKWQNIYILVLIFGLEDLMIFYLVFPAFA